MNSSVTHMPERTRKNWPSYFIWFGPCKMLNWLMWASASYFVTGSAAICLHEMWLLKYWENTSSAKSTTLFSSKLGELVELIKFCTIF